MTKVIGHGFLGKAFSKKKLKEKVIFFTSGVSNSNCISEKQFNRERKKILNLKIKKDELLIYFSTCGIYDPSRNKKKYFKHKVDMEYLIKKNFTKFLIIRLPELIGKNNNKKTLVNNIYYNLLSNKKIFLFNGSKRNLIHIEDVVNLTTKLIRKKISNIIINLANTRFILPIDLLKIFEKILNKKAKFKVINVNKKSWYINLTKIKNLIPKYNSIFNKNYIETSIKKNYS